MKHSINLVTGERLCLFLLKAFQVASVNPQPKNATPCII